MTHPSAEDEARMTREFAWVSVRSVITEILPNSQVASRIHSFLKGVGGAFVEKERMKIFVERISEDRWRIWPQDETWLGLATQHALEQDPSSIAAVVKEHPQHEGVLLRGEPEALRKGVRAVRELVVGLRRKGLQALRCDNYGVANLVRRTLLTRPLCLAADVVHFTDKVADAEYEPIAAHRIGQLTFCVKSEDFLSESQARLMVPPGEMAFARHLELPTGVTLLKGEEEAAIGLRASATLADGGLHELAVVDLQPDAVFLSKHAKHCAVAAVSYRPEVQISKPFPKGCADAVRKAGFSFSSSGVVGAKINPVRQEFVAQLMPDAVFERPKTIQLDFEALGYESKEAVLANAFDRLLAEIGDVEAQLGGEIALESSCPDVQPCTKSFCTA